MATTVAERKRYSEEEKQKHLDATKGKSFTEQGEYCEKQGISINTLRSWRRAKEGTTSTKSKGKRGRKPAKKSAKKKAAKKKPGPKPGRKAAKKKPGPKPGARRGRKPGPKPGSTRKAPSPVATSSRGLKGRVKDKLVEDFEDKLGGGEGTLDAEMHQLLTDVHNAL